MAFYLPYGLNEVEIHFFRQMIRSAVEVRTTKGRGTGVIISHQGLILTAAHVVRRHQQVNVRRLKLNRTYGVVTAGTNLRAEVIYRQARADIAVLRLIDRPTKLKPARIGRSDELRPRDSLYRIGRDKVPLACGHLYGFYLGASVKQALINIESGDGASGGPVFDSTGRLIALNLGRYFLDGKTACAFAVPIDNILRRIIKNDEVCDLL